MPALDLRKVTREELTFHRQLGSRKKPFHLECLGSEWELKLQSGVISRPGRFQVDADWGGARIFLRVDKAWVSQIAGKMLQLPFPVDLPEPIRLAILEAAFASAASALEEATRKRFSVLSATIAELPSLELTGFRLELDEDEHATEGELWVDSLGLGFLANAMRVVESAPQDFQNWEHLSVPIRFSAGWTNLSLDALEGLAKHDVILLDECWLSKGDSILVRIGNGNGIRGELVGTSITLTQGLEAMMNDVEEQAMEDVDLLDDIGIQISFDLGERNLTLAEVRRLAPGYVFELGRDLRRSVIIRANGKAIGEGELVDIEGQTGVSVMKISVRSD